MLASRRSILRAPPDATISGAAAGRRAHTLVRVEDVGDTEFLIDEQLDPFDSMWASFA